MSIEHEKWKRRTSQKHSSLIPFYHTTITLPNLSPFVIFISKDFLMLWPKDCYLMRTWLTRGSYLWTRQTELYNRTFGGRKVTSQLITPGLKRTDWRWGSLRTQVTHGSRMSCRLQDYARQSSYLVLRISTSRDGGRILIIHVFWPNGFCPIVSPFPQMDAMDWGVSLALTLTYPIWGWINAMHQPHATVTTISDRRDCWFMKWKLLKHPTTLNHSTVRTSAIGTPCRWVYFLIRKLYFGFRTCGWESWLQFSFHRRTCGVCCRGCFSGSLGVDGWSCHRIMEISCCFFRNRMIHVAR